MIISVIVPIYQVEKYISNCINSICNQTFKKFEIILVNDGTKDNSINIALDILLKTNIPYKVINQENKGVSAARNIGIKNSCGEWIICIDSDDVLEEMFLEVLYNGIKHSNAKVSIVNYSLIIKNNYKKSINKINNYKIYNSEIISELFLKRKINIISPAMLINKKFILGNNLFYNEKMNFSEDVHFIWRVILLCEFCAYNNTPLYRYIVRNNSTMTSSNSQKILTGYNGFLDFTSSLLKGNTKILKYIMARWVFGALHASAKMMSYNEFQQLANSMNYKKYCKVLNKFPDFIVKLLNIFLKYSLKSFYFISRIV